MQDYLNQLNDSQKLPTIHKDGPVMVIAGAGSGKTRVLTYRIAYLMEMGVDPFSILALTFTNKAAREMKERIGLIVGASKAKTLWMGTFHSIFARILRSEADYLGYSSNFSIYDTQDSERLISSIIKELKLDKDLYKYRNIRNRISSLKNNLVTVKAYYNNQELIQQDKESRRPMFGKIYQTYVNRCFKASAMDFDDLLLKTNELLNRFPEVLNKYQQRFKYIHVDEYQDTNHSQYLIVKALADKFENICVVGDDAQSIYGFRGANIENILSFQKDCIEGLQDSVESIFNNLLQKYGSKSSSIMTEVNDILSHLSSEASSSAQSLKINKQKVKIDDSTYTKNKRAGAVVGGVIGAGAGATIAATATTTAIGVTSIGTIGIGTVAAFSTAATIGIGIMTGGLGLLLGAGIASLLSAKGNSQRNNQSSYVEYEELVNNKRAILAVERFVSKLKNNISRISEMMVNSLINELVKPIDQQITSQNNLINQINTDLNQTVEGQQSTRDFLASKTGGVKTLNSQYQDLIKSVESL